MIHNCVSKSAVMCLLKYCLHAVKCLLRIRYEVRLGLLNDRFSKSQQLFIWNSRIDLKIYIIACSYNSEKSIRETPTADRLP